MATSHSVCVASDQIVPVLIATGTWPSAAGVVSTALESSHILKASPGSILSLVVAVTTASGWVLLLNATSLPGNGAVTAIWFMPVDSNGTNGYLSFSWGSSPQSFSTGCVVAFSTGASPFTLTASAKAAFVGQAQ
jgi:hypothetical protein